LECVSALRATLHALGPALEEDDEQDDDDDEQNNAATDIHMRPLFHSRLWLTRPTLTSDTSESAWPERFMVLQIRN
jgi:hypothetical protein